MTAFICSTCGTEYPPSEIAPDGCAICMDERQYVRAGGQSWTTVEAIGRSHSNAFLGLEPGLISIASVPKFSLGQRALLIRGPRGNFLWDCIPLLDSATVEIVRALGGLTGIAISHPHYYSTMVEWSRAFGDAPIHLHAADRQWIMRPDRAIRTWDGDACEVGEGLTLIRCGGHFAGGTVLHWAGGAGGSGALLSGDVVMVVTDRRYVTFMRSFPNMIPLPAPAVERIGARLRPYRFEAIYGAFPDQDIRAGGNAVVERSAARYVQALATDLDRGG